MFSSQLENCQVAANIKTVRPEVQEPKKSLAKLNFVEGSPRFTRSSDADPQANILIASDNPVRACLADFGFMGIVYDDGDGPESASALGGGTTPFMASELLSPVEGGGCVCVWDGDLTGAPILQRYLIAY